MRALYIILLIVAGVLQAQSPPGWLPLGNLNEATGIEDIVKIPWSAQNSAIAVGYDRAGNHTAGIWKSTDSGDSWSYKYWPGSGTDKFWQLALDETHHRLWCVGDFSYGTAENPLYYSPDEGDNWSSIAYPAPRDSVGDGKSLLILNSTYIYYGGEISSLNKVKFYRLDTSNPNPALWSWEYVTTFNGASGIQRLYHSPSAGKIYAWVKTASVDQVKIYELSPDAPASAVTHKATLPVSNVWDIVAREDSLYLATDYLDNYARVYFSSNMASWSLLREWPGNSQKRARCIGFINDTLLVGIEGEAPLAYKSTDYGTSWQAVYSPEGATGVLTASTIGSETWIGTSGYGDLFVAHWNVTSGGEYVFGPTWVYSATPHNGDIYFSTDYDYGEIYRMDNSGTASLWVSFADASEVYDVAWFGDTAMVALDGGNLIKRSSDNGSSWQDVFKPEGATAVYSIFPTQGNELLIGTSPYGDVFRSNYIYQIGGHYIFNPTWVYQAKVHDNAIYFTTDYDFGEIYRMTSPSSASVWQTFNDAGEVYDISWWNDTVFVSLDSPGLLKRSSDNGTSWQEPFKPEGATAVYSVFPTQSDELLIGTGSYGDVFRSNYIYQTGGHYIFNPTWVHQAKVHGDAIYFTTNYDFGEIYRMTSPSSASVWQTFNDASEVYDISWWNDTVFVSLDSPGLLKRSSDDGTSWQEPFKPEGATAVYSVFPTRSDELLIGTSPYGDVFRSNYIYQTGGHYIFNPTWVYQARVHENAVYFTTDYDFGETYQMTSPSSASVWQTFNDASEVYDLNWWNDTVFVALDSPGLLKRSSDEGTSWQEPFKPEGATAVYSVFPTRSDELLIGTSPYGDVFRSNYIYQMGGKYIFGPIWVNDVAYYQDNMYIATNMDNGEIWKSENSGQDWTNLTQNSQPWNRAYTLLAFGNTIYAGTDYNGDVYKSNDGGQNWSPTGDLANATDVYSLYPSQVVQPNRIFAGTGPYGDVFLSDSSAFIGNFTQVDSAGWNLTGLPLEVADAHYLTLYPNAVQNTLFGWDGTYQLEDSLIVGAGYWLRFPAKDTVTINGLQVNSVQLNLMEGWNLISGLSCPMSLTDINDPSGIIIPGTLFGFNGVYYSTDTLMPGKGYWIRTGAAGMISMSCEIGFTPILAKQNFSPFNLEESPALQITDATGAAQTLYWSAEELSDEQMLSYSLPPLPPTGAFDARFAGDSRACFGEEATVFVQSTSFPMTLCFSAGAGEKTMYEIEEMIGDKIVGQHRVLSGMQLSVTNPTVNCLHIRKIATMPEEFRIFQNYPNPFNPATTFKFALPEKTRVEVVIYNSLGQRIKTIAKAEKEPGFYQLSWDGTNDRGQSVATGVYLYSIKAGKYHAVRKMLLLR